MKTHRKVDKCQKGKVRRSSMREKKKETETESDKKRLKSRALYRDVTSPHASLLGVLQTPMCYHRRTHLERGEHRVR